MKTSQTEKRETEKKETVKMAKIKEQGITLIALIIIIIVLLILASITISALAGDNGILSNAARAKEETEVASEKEQVTLAYMGAKTETLGEKVGATDVNTQLQLQRFKSRGKWEYKCTFYR